MDIYKVQGQFGGILNISASSFGEAEAKFRNLNTDARKKTMMIISIEIIARDVII